MSITTATIYSLPEPIDHEKLCSMPVWEMPAKTVNHHIARLNIGKEPCQALSNGSSWYRIRRSWKQVDASAVKVQLAEAVERFEQQHQTKIPAAHKRTLKEEIHAKLLLAMPHKHADTDIIVTLDHLIIGSTAKHAESITNTLRELLKSLNTRPFPEAFRLTDCVMPMINTGELAIDNITLGGRISAVMPDDGRLSLSSWDFDDGILSVLKQAKKITSARLGWHDVNATINEQATLSQIQTDVTVIHQGEEYEDQVAEDRAVMFYLAQKLPQFLRDLSLHQG